MSFYVAAAVHPLRPGTIDTLVFFLLHPARQRRTSEEPARRRCGVPHRQHGRLVSGLALADLTDSTVAAAEIEDLRLFFLHPGIELPHRGILPALLRYLLLAANVVVARESIEQDSSAGM